MQQFAANLPALLSTYLPRLLGALAILVAGWIIALVAAAVVRGVLRRTSLDNRLAQWIFGDRAQTVPVERGAGTITFWLVMLFVLMAVFQALQLTVVTEPLNALLGQVGRFAPKLLGALLLALAAGALALLLRRVVGRGLALARADERLGEGGAPLSKTLGEAVYWLVWLLFLPAILSTLELTGLLEPVQALLNKALAFLPNLFAAALILLAGWFVATLVRRIVSHLLAAVGADQLGERMGVSRAMGGGALSSAVGSVVYVLVLLPVAIAALNALQIEAVTRPASNMLDRLLAAVPAIFAAAIVLVLSWVVGRIVADLVARTLAGVGFDNLFATLGFTRLAAGSATEAPGKRPSGVAGSLVLVAILAFAAIEAAGLLHFTALQDLLRSSIGLAGHVLLGLAIFGVGLYLANLAAGVIAASGMVNASLLATLARVAILILVGAMALRQMGLANEIINLAFGILLGAVAVAAAIAFGLGGRDAAARQVEEWSRQLKGR